LQEKSNILKFVFFGPQNTGKTTLCEKIARYFNVDYVPEFSRIYAESNKVLSYNTVLPIANGQLKLEEDAINNANKLLFFDTNLLETLIYSNLYYNKVPKELEQMVEKQNYTLYFLPYIDVCWQEDSIRDLPTQREEHYNLFKAELEKRNLPFIELKGTFEERINKATKEVKRILKQSEI